MGFIMKLKITITNKVFLSIFILAIFLFFSLSLKLNKNTLKETHSTAEVENPTVLNDELMNLRQTAETYETTTYIKKTADLEGRQWAETPESIRPGLVVGEALDLPGISPNLIGGINFGNDLFKTLQELLVEAESRHEAQILIAQAQEVIYSLPVDVAVDKLIEYLESGDNIETTLSFLIGQHGTLSSHPTLRVAALDWLGNLSPGVAQDYALEVFESSDSPDEWALAIRNYGRVTDPGTDEFFNEILSYMITHPEWRTRPSDGYLEAYDAVVYNRQYDLIPSLVQTVMADPGLDMVAMAVIDSFVQQNRAEALAYVYENMDLFNEIPELRATLFSRADLGDNGQRVVIENYLNSPTTSLKERDLFLRLFPNVNLYMAHRLLTTTQNYSLRERAEFDYISLKVITDWLSDERFTELHPVLRVRQQHLNHHVETAIKHGLLKKGQVQ
jgi:hypothetical protein